MKSTPTIENASTWFNAKTVTHNLDVDHQAVDVDTRTADDPKKDWTSGPSFFEDATSDEPWLVIVEPN